MTYLVIYICKDPIQEVYWFSRTMEMRWRPNKDDVVMFNTDDIGATQAIVSKVYDWGHISSAIDFEVVIAVPPPQSHSDAAEAERNWLSRHGFHQVPREEYAELFGVPELAERWPKS